MKTETSGEDSQRKQHQRLPFDDDDGVGKVLGLVSGQVEGLPE